MSFGSSSPFLTPSIRGVGLTKDGHHTRFAGAFSKTRSTTVAGLSGNSVGIVGSQGSLRPAVDTDVTLTLDMAAGTYEFSQAPIADNGSGTINLVKLGEGVQSLRRENHDDGYHNFTGNVPGKGSRIGWTPLFLDCFSGSQAQRDPVFEPLSVGPDSSAVLQH